MKITLLLIISVLTMNLHAQDSVKIGKTGYRKDNPGDFRSLVREGNSQYNAGKSEDAEKSYRRALDVDEKSNLAAFNLGDALYRQQKYDEAVKEFERTASGMTDKADKARAYHNLGNSYLQQQKLKESIEAYKQALRNNPNDPDTKYNLSYALNMLKEQEQQQNQDNKDNKDNKDNQDNQDNKDQQNQDQDQQQDQKKDEKQQDQQQQQISREDAQRMLEAIAQEEKELQEKLQKQERAGQRSKIEKNW